MGHRWPDSVCSAPTCGPRRGPVKTEVRGEALSRPRGVVLAVRSVWNEYALK